MMLEMVRDINAKFGDGQTPSPGRVTALQPSRRSPNQHPTRMPFRRTPFRRVFRRDGSGDSSKLAPTMPPVGAWAVAIATTVKNRTALIAAGVTRTITPDTSHAPRVKQVITVRQW
jgi:hypothetical protein